MLVSSAAMVPSGVPNRARLSSSRWAAGLACTTRNSGSSATSRTPYGASASASQTAASDAVAPSVGRWCVLLLGRAGAVVVGLHERQLGAGVDAATRCGAESPPSTMSLTYSRIRLRAMPFCR